jgi:multisubunit Na+/H+ antiporter MnhB subunit
MVLSFYFFFAGHNTPGGGFAGGLTAGLALVLRYLAGGRYELGETLPLDAGKILGAGLGLSAATATASLLLGAPALSSALIELDVPVLGHVKFVTALFFDLGVYLIVVGLVLDVLRSLGARLDEEMAGPRCRRPHRSAHAPDPDRGAGQLRGVPAAGPQPDPNVVGPVADRQRHQPADPHRRRTVGQSPDPRTHRHRPRHHRRPLAQAMILTAIVITMGVAAFVLALTTARTG